MSNHYGELASAADVQHIVAVGESRPRPALIVCRTMCHVPERQQWSDEDESALLSLGVLDIATDTDTDVATYTRLQESEQTDSVSLIIFFFFFPSPSPAS
ncbi:hypothetical protein A4X06_0g8022 [Tilletia controversa]|uniref:Uncharacterized protein n=1 Tax=Tilletia controversa TaxID=13291 RepID=A0A8X7MKS3_9BASI|nr:hypothetical protein CF328_g7240 [Tilletia controversa]KAE8239826.1 hypothetical protein A4X06_0g8022 [Tilletia controversa]